MARWNNRPWCQFGRRDSGCDHTYRSRVRLIRGFSWLETLMGMYFDLKRGLLISAVSVLGWLFGFAIYWMIGPNVLSLINTELNHQQSVHTTQGNSANVPATEMLPARYQFQKAIVRRSTSDDPQLILVKMLLVKNQKDQSRPRHVWVVC